MIDISGGRGRLRCESADLTGYHCKSSAHLTGSGRFDGRIQSKQRRLTGNLADRLADPVNGKGLLRKAVGRLIGSILQHAALFDLSGKQFHSLHPVITLTDCRCRNRIHFLHTPCHAGQFIRKLGKILIRLLGLLCHVINRDHDLTDRIFHGMIIGYRIFHRYAYRIKLCFQSIGCLDHLLYNLIQTTAQFLDRPVHNAHLILPHMSARCVVLHLQLQLPQFYDLLLHRNDRSGDTVAEHRHDRRRHHCRDQHRDDKSQHYPVERLVIYRDRRGNGNTSHTAGKCRQITHHTVIVLDRERRILHGCNICPVQDLQY